jgi:hypothetical protein
MTAVIAIMVGQESTLLPGKAYGITMKRGKAKGDNACQLTTSNN